MQLPRHSGCNLRQSRVEKSLRRMQIGLQPLFLPSAVVFGWSTTFNYLFAKLFYYKVPHWDSVFFINCRNNVLLQKARPISEETSEVMGIG